MLAVVGRALSRVVGDRNAELLARPPHRVEGRVVEGRDVRHVVGTARQQHAAAQPVLGDPVDVGDGVIDVIQEDLPDAGAPVGRDRAEVGEPAVVRPDAGQAQLVLLGRRRTGDHGTGREERRHRVREDHLADDTVGLELAEAALVVPVARAQVAVEILVRVLVAVAPRVELVAVLRVEVLAVLLVAAAGVGVGRDQRVAIGASHLARHASLSRLNTRSAFSRRNFGHTWSRNGTSGSSVKMRSSDRPIG